MAIWRKKKQRTPEQGELIEEKRATRTQPPESNSCHTHSRKELAAENEGKLNANEEEVINLKAPTIPDLNVPYKEEVNSNDVIVSAWNLSNNSCMINISEATMNIHKYQTYVPPKLVVKGCQACYIFVMVQETDPRCPNCRVGTYLFDVCHEFHAKKKRLI